MEALWEATQSALVNDDVQIFRNILQDVFVGEKLNSNATSMSSSGRARIKVFCRFRPQNSREKRENPQLCLVPPHKDTNDKDQDHAVNAAAAASQDVTLQTMDDATHNYSFDRIFYPDATQAEVFESTGAPIIEAVLTGFNGAIIAYGQTGAGKTWTMEGSKDNKGIINRAMDQLFDYATQAASSIEFEVKVSFVEIYNENILDLLNPQSSTNLKIRNSKVVGCREIFVTSPTEMERILAIGAA